MNQLDKLLEEHLEIINESMNRNLYNYELTIDDKKFYLTSMSNLQEKRIGLFLGIAATMPISIPLLLVKELSLVSKMHHGQDEFDLRNKNLIDDMNTLLNELASENIKPMTYEELKSNKYNKNLSVELGFDLRVLKEDYVSTTYYKRYLLTGNNKKIIYITSYQSSNNYNWFPLSISIPLINRKSKEIYVLTILSYQEYFY